VFPRIAHARLGIPVLAQLLRQLRLRELKQREKPRLIVRAFRLSQRVNEVLGERRGGLDDAAAEHAGARGVLAEEHLHLQPAHFLERALFVQLEEALAKVRVHRQLVVLLHEARHVLDHLGHGLGVRRSPIRL